MGIRYRKRIKIVKCKLFYIKIQGHTSNIYSVAYSPDGKYIISGSDDRSIKIWESDTGKELKQLNVNYFILKFRDIQILLEVLLILLMENI